MFATTVNGTNGTICELKKEAYFLSVPKGMILAYAGSTAPSGYALCDGTNGTPDLRNCVPVHHSNIISEFKIANTKCGSDTHVLTVNEIPKHSHGLFWGDNREIDDMGNVQRRVIFNDEIKVFLPSFHKNVDKKHQDKRRKLTQRPLRGTLLDENIVTLFDKTMTTGNGEGHENRQPFTYVNFIMKL